jgi:dual specificity phosphatase 12
VHPNYGFIKQLEVFADCHYDPSPSHVAYTKWKRHQRQNVTQFLNSMVDTTEIVHNQLLLSRFVSSPRILAAFLTVSCSDFPEDPSQAEALLLDLEITHLLSLSPAQISVSSAAAALPSPSTTHHHINLPERQDALITALPDACEFLRKAIERGGRVLVHCLIESRACIVACAYRTSYTYLLLHKHLTSPAVNSDVLA